MKAVNSLASPPSQTKYLFGLVTSRVFFLVLACLIAAKLDEAPGTGFTWFAVFSPYWAHFIILYGRLVYRLGKLCCGGNKGTDTVDGASSGSPTTSSTPLAGQEAPKLPEDSIGSIFATFIGIAIYLACVLLVVFKLENPSAYSTFIVFIPVFVSVSSTHSVICMSICWWSMLCHKRNCAHYLNPCFLPSQLALLCCCSCCSLVMLGSHAGAGEAEAGDAEAPPATQETAASGVESSGADTIHVTVE
jgi:hypothetical protein